MIDRSRSQSLFDEAKNYFPGGVNSPVRAFKSVNGPPVFVKHGSGPYIYDEDDNEYLDFCCSWGPLILGHNHPSIRAAVIDTVKSGTSFGTPTIHGNRLGKLIIDNHSFIERMRFVSSGTEAVMSAIRLARGYTGRSKIIKFEGCYHGHVDSILVKAGSGLATFGVGSSAGIPPSFVKETIVLQLDDEPALEEAFHIHKQDLAAVIIEPIPANNGLLIQRDEFLRKVRDLCTRYDVLLIFDEVISGFRVGFEGAAGTYNIKPDLITFGKVIGGGLPVGAFAGSQHIMRHIAPEGPVYQAGTLSANPVAMAAGYAALQEVLKEGFYQDLVSKVKTLTEPINSHAEEHKFPVTVRSIGSIFWICFSRASIRRADQINSESMEHFKKLHSILMAAGIYLGPSGYEVGFVSSAHTHLQLANASKIICQSLDQIFS
jgi:glutamate-1-semialdehyde 2,1-aminomutase